MNITTFLIENKSKLTKAKKLNVRDIDEVEKNQFVAYVDDTNDSFDVQINLDTKKNIKSSTCDCDAGGICLHIIALANFIVDKKNEKTILKKPRSKKQTETDVLLQSLDNDTLRIWISETLNTNKELAFIFKNQFEVKKEIVYTSEIIKEIVKESLQSVIGKRRKIETNEVKKFVDALTISSKELLEFLNQPPITKEKYKLINVLIDELQGVHYNFQISSIKITRFIEAVLDSLLKNLFIIKDIEVWEQSVKFYFSLIFNDRFNLFELHQCEKIYEFSKTNNVQKNKIVTIIEENVNAILIKTNQEQFNFGVEMESFFLKVFLENNLFDKNASKFKPRLFQNEYNIKLLDALMNSNQYNLVENYCHEIITRNYQEKYNVPYLKYLISIYKTNKEDEKLAKLYSIYGKFIYDIKVYLFIKENLPEAEFKKYRMAAFSHARNSYQNGDLEAFNFYFEIKKLDEKEYDLFEMLINSRNISFVNQYKEIALNLNENKFVEILFRFNYNYYDNIEDIKNLAKFTIERVDVEKLKTNLKIYSRFSYSKFYKMIEELVG